MCAKAKKERSSHLRTVIEAANKWGRNAFLGKTPLASGGNNLMYATADPGIVLRRAKKKSKSLEGRQAETSELALQEVLGDAGIGPSIFWHSSPDHPETLVLQAFANSGDLTTFLSKPRSPVILALLAKKIVKLICRVAFLGFLALDMKPENIVVSYDAGRASPLCVRLIDFDPRFFRKVSNPQDVSHDEAMASLAAVSFRVMLKLLRKHLLSLKGAFKLFADDILDVVGRSPSRFRGKDVEHVIEVIRRAPSDIWKHYFSSHKPRTAEELVGGDGSTVSNDPNAPVSVGKFDFLSPSSLEKCMSSPGIRRAASVLHRLSSEQNIRNGD
jgi:hypothetical protein